MAIGIDEILNDMRRMRDYVATQPGELTVYVPPTIWCLYQAASPEEQLAMRNAVRGAAIEPVLPLPVSEFDSEFDETDERTVNMIQAAFEEHGWQPFESEWPESDAPQSE